VCVGMCVRACVCVYVAFYNEVSAEALQYSRESKHHQYFVIFSLTVADAIYHHCSAF